MQTSCLVLHLLRSSMGSVRRGTKVIQMNCKSLLRYALLATAFRTWTASAAMVRSDPDFASAQSRTARLAGADRRAAYSSDLKVATGCQSSGANADNERAVAHNAQKSSATGKSKRHRKSKSNVAGQSTVRKVKPAVRHLRRSSKTDRAEDAQSDAQHD